MNGLPGAVQSREVTEPQRDPLAVNMPSPSEEGEGGPLAVDEVSPEKNIGHCTMLKMRLRAQDLIRHGRTMQDMCNQTFSVAARDTFSKEEGFTLFKSFLSISKYVLIP